MVVNTQHTSEVADKAQQGVMELLLINHPLDCPVCDKGGECPLQNQAMSNGRSTSRFEDVKRTYPKPINISSQVLLDRERCVLCARCTRFSDQIAGDPFIALVERGALQQVGIYEDQPFESYFSGNTVQICPVGALTGAAYRFRSRPFDLVSTPSVCEHCASGCAHPHRPPPRHRAAPDGAERPGGQRGVELRQGPLGLRLRHARRPPRAAAWCATTTASCASASWPEALEAAAAGLRAASAAGVLVGGRVSAEDAYAYGKFARIVLGTNDVDFRARPHSAEEADFLAATVVATGPDGGAVTYADLERAGTVLLVGLRARGREPDRLPAPAQGVPQAPHRRVRRGPGRDPRPGQGGRHAHPDRPRHRGRGAAAPSPRAPAPTSCAAAGRGPARQRASCSSASGSRRSPGALTRRGRPGRGHRRPARLGAPPRR